MKKKQTGPTSLGLGTAFSVQLFAEDLVLVETLARTRRVSKGSAIRQIVSDALAKYKTKGKQNGAS